MEHAVEADRPARLDAERDDVLDLEVDRVADPDAVPEAVVLDPSRQFASVITFGVSAIAAILNPPTSTPRSLPP